MELQCLILHPLRERRARSGQQLARQQDVRRLTLLHVPVRYDHLGEIGEDEQERASEEDQVPVQWSDLVELKGPDQAAGAEVNPGCEPSRTQSKALQYGVALQWLVGWTSEPLYGLDAIRCVAGDEAGAKEDDCVGSFGHQDRSTTYAHGTHQPELPHADQSHDEDAANDAERDLRSTKRRVSLAHTSTRIHPTHPSPSTSASS